MWLHEHKSLLSIKTMYIKGRYFTYLWEKFVIFLNKPTNKS